MRVLVFFDLPTESNEDKRNYRIFRKLLIKSGFLMLQESVYCRMLLTPGAGKSVIDTLRRHKPPKGIVQILTVTEKQFSGIECITGEFHSEILDSDERLVVL